MPRREARPVPPMTSEDVARFWNRVDKSGGPQACWPWTGCRMADGRGQIRLGGRAGQLVLTPRVAYALGGKLGNPQNRQVLHRCDNPPCCNPVHLYLGDYAENHTDMDARGRRRINPQPGESNGQAKLNDQAVLAMRFCRAAGAPLEILAALYGVGQALVSGITTGRTWCHVAGPVTRGPRFTRRGWTQRQEVAPCA